MYIGKREYFYDSMSVAELYKEKAERDEKAARILLENGLYNQSAYFLIQAMEKQITSKIAIKVDVTNTYFATEIRKTMGHSLEKSAQFLITIYTGNYETLRVQMEQQLIQQVLKGIYFKGLHNNVRYPLYHERYSSYSSLEICHEECLQLFQMLNRLKIYLSELDKQSI